VTRYPRDEGEQQYGNHKRPTRQVRNLTSDNSTDGSKTADQKFSQSKIRSKIKYMRSQLILMRKTSRLNKEIRAATLLEMN
jgi:hypothetical protein